MVAPDPHPLDLRPVPPGSEQRRHPRAFVTVAVSLEVGDEIVRGTECRNISMGGMFVSTPRPLPVGTPGTVTLTKRCGEKNHSFSAEFRVVRSEASAPQGPGVGIYFSAIGPADLENLRAIVDFHLSIVVKEKLRLSEERVEGMSFKIADTREELEQAFAVVHDSYVTQGYMDPDPSGMRLTLFHALPQSATAVAKAGNRVVMASTVFPDSLLGLPMDSLYRDDLRRYRESGAFIGEVGAFATVAEFREGNANAPLHLQKLLNHYCTQCLGLDAVVITINPKHRLFYQHVLLMEQFGAEREYSFVKGAVAVPMRLSLAEAPARFEHMYQGLPPEKNLHDFFYRRRSGSIELPAAGEPLSVWTRDLVRYFFEERSDLFKRSDRKTVSLIKSLYP